MAQKLYLSWQDIELGCKSLAKKFSQKNFDLIIAPARGGLPPAVILSNKYLNHIPVITLGLKEIAVEGKANYQVNQVKIIFPLNKYPIKNKRILLLDDVADSGASLIKAFKLIKRHQPKSIVTAALHYKPRSAIIPEYFVRKIPSNTWIVYPWEELAKTP